MEIAKEEFLQWKNSAVTEYVFKELSEDREVCMETLRSYATIGDKVQAARMAGMIEGLDNMLAIEYEDPEEDDKDA